mmetsp:Transcript_862/g.1266  ORF Transcript_862/g.1266 Transcript_862/m.1266 type:complete len:106 (-) Transcript_862:343-660(-)
MTRSQELWLKLRNGYKLAAFRMIRSERERLLDELEKIQEIKRALDIEQKESLLCKICFDRDINTTSLSCGHSCMCDCCARKLFSCPICMKPLSQLVWEPRKNDDA